MVRPTVHYCRFSGRTYLCKRFTQELLIASARSLLSRTNCFRQDSHYEMNAVLSFCRSLYPVDRSPFWICRLTAWYWFGDFRYCKCCLFAAASTISRGPDLEQLEYSARAGCRRCSIVSQGLRKYEHVFQAQENDDPSQHLIGINIREQSVSVLTSGRHINGRGYWDIYHFQFFIDEGMIMLPPTRYPLTDDQAYQTCYQICC